MAGVARRITPGHSYINNKLFTASSAKERKLCSGAASLVKDTASAESSQLKNIANKIEKILRKTASGFTGLVASLYGNLILATEPVNSFSNSMYAMSQLMGYTIGGKLGEMEYFLAGQIVGDKISSVAGGLIQAAGKTVSQFGTALDLYMAWNGIGGGKPSAQIVGGGSVAIEGNAAVGGIGTIAGVAIGGAISAFGENLKDSAEENEALHEEQLEKLSEEKSGIYKEVNVHGQINTELDEVDLKNGIIYEDKSASNLYMENPNYPQTEMQWAEKQIYQKGKNRIEALLQDEFSLSSKSSFSLPDIESLKEIKSYIFRIDADTPELRNAVQVQLDKLSNLYPDFNFEATFGGQ